MSGHFKRGAASGGAGKARTSGSWPQGAFAGLALVAAACIAFGAVLYQVAGPRDVFAEDSSFDPR